MPSLGSPTVTGDTVDFGSGDVLRVKEVCGQSGNLNDASERRTIVYDAWRLDGAYPSVVHAYAAVSAIIPSTWDGLAPNALDWDEDGDTNHLLFKVQYDSRPPLEQIRWSFDTTGGTIKLTTSKHTDRYAPSGRVAPDFKGAIGVKNTGKDAEPEGVEVVIPGLKLTATYKFPKNTIDLAYIKSLSAMTGHTNDDTWYTFDQGELLFLGGTGELVEGLPTEIQYHYLASANASGLTIGDISSIAKAGHNYLWVAFEASEDTSAKKLVQRPLGVYVERVYDEADFTSLGIGS
jgi:hypothetical protein